MSPKPVIGIDLGTTNCQVSFIAEDGRPEIIKNRTGDRRTETAVWFQDGGGEPVFGKQARRMAPVKPDRVIFQAKPEWDQPGVSYSVDGEKLEPLDLAALFYGHLVKQAEESLGGEVKRAVITVPAYFHQIGREIMKKGAEKAGLKVERVLREPAAAAVGYALSRPLEDKETILVYDLGGGTFDCSLLEAGEENGSPKLKILGNRGDTQLGGRDFDRLILERVFQKSFKAEHGQAPTDDPRVEAQWLEDAEQVKKDLTDSHKALTLLQGGKSHQVEVTRDQFNSLIQPDIDKTINIIGDLLQDTSVNKSQIDRLVLVGGSTRIKAIRDQVTDFIGKEPVEGVDPDLAVTVGAALIAGVRGNQIIRGKSGVRIPLLESSIKEVTSHALGVRAVNQAGEEFNQVLIDAGQPLRATGTQLFRPTKDDASKVEITILQGKARDLDQCRILQEGYELPISTPRSASLVEVEVEMAINKDGLIEIVGRTNEGDEIREEFRHPRIVNRNK